MSSEPRYYVEPDNQKGYSHIGDRECPVYGEVTDHHAVIMVCGHMADGVNTAHVYAEQLTAILNAGPSMATVSLPANQPTQRQLYKAAALQGLVAGGGKRAVNEFVGEASAIADAMLAEDEEHAKK